MNRNTAYLFRLTLLIAAISISWTSAFSQNREVGEQTVVLKGDRTVVPVLARSSNAATKQILETAFSVHGGFQLVGGMADASFAVSIDPVGPSGARLSISSGVPEKVLFTETLAGDSGYEAVLAALDRAVAKMSGRPGFFSGKLAFVSEETGSSEVYTGDLLFRKMRRLTSDNVSAVRPRWSPEGKSIVYTSYKSGFPDIHRLDLVSNRREVLVDFKGVNLGARYSPDGRRMAMVLSGSGNADLWVREESGALKNLSKSKGLEAAPSWSPDGGRIVFSSDQSGGVQLYVVPSRGGSMRRLRTDIAGYCAEPDWNPVASEDSIVFTAAMRDGYQIAVFDMTKGESRFITSERGDAIEPQWLNDGRHVVYTHRRANSSEIKIVDTVTLKSYSLSGSRGKVYQASFVAN